MSAPTRRRGPSKGDRKQEALLETAEKLLAVKPLAEIGIEELARGAGISRSSFYFYFESRQAMLLALLSRASDDLLTQVECWLEPHADRRQSVRQSIELAVKMWGEHGAVLLAAESPDAPPEAREFMADLNGRLIAVTEDMIERSRAAGTAPAGPPCAHSLATMLVGMTEHVISHNAESLGEDELVDTLTVIWHRAVFATD